VQVHRRLHRLGRGVYPIRHHRVAAPVLAQHLRQLRQALLAQNDQFEDYLTSSLRQPIVLTLARQDENREAERAQGRRKFQPLKRR
jgi:hypothetical protein